MAAGKGKRLKSRTPKVLHQVAGRPVLWHVLTALRPLRPDPVALVVNHDSERIREEVEAWNLGLRVRFVDQGDPLGTGHAVMVAERAVGKADDVLVLPGDEPLVSREQLRELVTIHRRRDVAAVVQTTIASNPKGFGRVIRDDQDLVRITEGDEASTAELRIAEVATSVYAFRRDDLYRALPLITRETKQHEYYLHHVLPILQDKGERIALQLVDNGGAVGANTRAELAEAATVMRRRINEALMAHGVTLVDPDRTYIDAGVAIGPDAVVYPMTFLIGETRIGPGAHVGPLTRVEDSRIDADARVEMSVVRGARIGRGASVGPYAHIRPGTVLGPDAKAGSFVEIKASRIGEGSKVPHLSYVGDAVIGRNVNVGAGTITCNYDGSQKHRTVIGDEAFIGSDTMLVAPVRIGRGAVTGAGSTITRDVPAGALAVERSEQRNVRGYAKRRRAKGTGKRRSGKARGGER
jgi:bifunctional UDP-N-acetylglucosamine pyrophosphorylase/glucosamine-1-phosphate N-acetyltransferase